MTTLFSIAPVKKTLTVNAAQAHAFDVFTKGIDRWWPPQHHLGESPVKQQVLEPHLGGRWYTIHQDGSETLTGIMLVWEPPSRFVFSWNINAQWKPDTTVGSEVEVRFVAQSATVTRVELEHRKFESLGEEGGKQMRAGVEGGWTGILEQFRKAAEV